MAIPKKEDMKPLGQEVYTDGTLAYKFYRDYPYRHPEIEVKALKRVQDIPRTQKFIDYDEGEQVLVTRLAKGHLLDEKSEEFQTGILTYSPQKIQNLIRTLIGMQEQGVVFESHARNLLYDNSQGFTPIDYNIPMEAHIDLGSLINILSLKGVPVWREGVQFSSPQNGKNGQNHPDVRKMIYEAFREVDSEKASEEIERFEGLEKSFRDLSRKLATRQVGYRI